LFVIVSSPKMSEFQKKRSCGGDNSCTLTMKRTSSLPGELKNIHHTKNSSREELSYEEHMEQMIIGWLRNLPDIPRSTPRLLPPKRLFKRKTPTIVLDLDQTLVYSSVSALRGCKGTVGITFAGQSAWVHPRPGLEQFLRSCRSWYDEMILWTAGKTEYALAAINGLGIKQYFDHLLFNANCHMVELESVIPPLYGSGGYLDDDNKTNDCGKLFFKPLCLLNRDQCFLIDDSKEMIAFNSSDQVLHIKPFTGDYNDQELTKLLPFLKQLSQSKTLGADMLKHQQNLAKGCSSGNRGN